VKKGKANEEVLLRNLASVYVQQEAPFDPGNRQLHRHVLETFLSFLSSSPVALFRAASLAHTRPVISQPAE
jgi:hypothetical protein